MIQGIFLDYGVLEALGTLNPNSPLRHPDIQVGVPHYHGRPPLWQAMLREVESGFQGAGV